MKPNQTIAEQALAQLTRTAHQYRRQGDHDRFLKLMEQALALHPQKHEIAMDVGLSFLMRYEYPSAEHWFERVVAITPYKAQALESIAHHWRNHSRYEMAERCLERACAMTGATADMFAKLGEMYERSRQMDKARENAAKALHLDGDNAMALLLSARLARSSNELEEGEKTVRRFLNRTDRESLSARIRGGYELGANLDRQGRYDEAMSAFVSAKSVLLPNWQSTIALGLQLRQDGYRAGEALLRQMLEVAAPSESSAARRHRVAVICGHPRSGTTLLEQILDSHPRTISAEETLVFHDALEQLMPNNSPDKPRAMALDHVAPADLEKMRNWYLDTMQKFLGQPIGDRLLIDKNPALTARIPSLMRFFPDARAIVAIRDPRDVCLSCFMQPLPVNPLSCAYLSLESTADEYAGLMGFWLAIRPMLKENALEVRYEDVVSDLESSARTALKFLNLDWDPVVLKFNEHAKNKLVRSPSYSAVTQPVSKNAVGRWRNYEKYLLPILPKLLPFIQAFGYEN